MCVCDCVYVWMNVCVCPCVGAGVIGCLTKLGHSRRSKVSTSVTIDGNLEAPKGTD